MDTPCPPYYAEPTHQQTLVFSTTSYVRHYNDWYQCIEGVYCNAPSFLGYSPPGEGAKWREAWTRLDDGGYPCNPTLELSGSGAVGGSWGGGAGAGFGPSVGGTSRPTNDPTRRADSPSTISGAVWYDANGDGRRNTVGNALTKSDYAAASRERGAGMSDMRVTLRECGSRESLGVTYTFPRSFGLGSGEGGGTATVIDASYIESIQSQEQEAILNGITNDGLGIGNTEGRLGYYSFKIPPHRLPGMFYVAFESPEGYRLTGGSGDFWEVKEAAMRDRVQPLMEPLWEADSGDGGGRGDNNDSNRRLQEEGVANQTETIGGNATGTISNYDLESNVRTGPIEHSGYYARSDCISIVKSPTLVNGIDAGLAEDSWPLIPFQYASLVVTIKFFDSSHRPLQRMRGLQGAVTSLECRRYQKLKSEGVEVQDIWGCDAATSGSRGPKVVYEELTKEEGEEVVNSVKEFLVSRASRVWTVRYVGLAYQELTTFKPDKGRGRRRRTLENTVSEDHGGNVLVASLDLGLRMRAEFASDDTRGDLSGVLVALIRNGAESFLLSLRGIPEGAGGVDVREDLRLYTEGAEKGTDSEPESAATEKENEAGVTTATYPVEDLSSLEENTEESAGSMSIGLLIGIVVGSVLFLSIIVVGLLLYRRRKRRVTSQAKNLPGGKGVKTQAGMKNKLVSLDMRDNGGDDESHSSSEFGENQDDDFDDLSSRFYSDSSKFDPNARLGELDAFGGEDDGSYSIETRSKGHSERSEEYSDGDSHGTGLRSSYASRYFAQNMGALGVGDSYGTGLNSSYTSGFSSKNSDRLSADETNGTGLNSSYASGYSTRKNERVRSGDRRGTGLGSSYASSYASMSIGSSSTHSGASRGMSRRSHGSSFRSGRTSRGSVRSSHRRAEQSSGRSSGGSSTLDSDFSYGSTNGHGKASLEHTEDDRSMSRHSGSTRGSRPRRKIRDLA